MVVYRYEHPYLYGALNKMDYVEKSGPNTQKLQWHPPFAISRHTTDGKEIIYGTIIRTVERAMIPISKWMPDFDALVHSSNMTPEEIIEQQDFLTEDALLTTAIYVRILSEWFPNKARQFKIPIYNYDGEQVDGINLKRLGDLVAHQKYISVRNGYVVDLISTKRNLNRSTQLGLKFCFIDYLNCLASFVDSFTVKDLATKLWSLTHSLSRSSKPTDIVFLVQNLHALRVHLVDVGPP